MADAQQAISSPGQPAVITLPTELDLAGSRRLCGQLGAALAIARVVIADMTATTFCDSAGVRILLLAQEQAAATGVELRLVVPSASVLRTLASMGADWLMPIYPSLDEAMGHQAPRYANGTASS